MCVGVCSPSCVYFLPGASGGRRKSLAGPACRLAGREEFADSLPPTRAFFFWGDRTRMEITRGLALMTLRCQCGRQIRLGGLPGLAEDSRTGDSLDLINNQAQQFKLNSKQKMCQVRPKRRARLCCSAADCCVRRWRWRWRWRTGELTSRRVASRRVTSADQVLGKTRRDAPECTTASTGPPGRWRYFRPSHPVQRGLLMVGATRVRYFATNSSSSSSSCVRIVPHSNAGRPGYIIFNNSPHDRRPPSAP